MTGELSDYFRHGIGDPKCNSHRKPRKINAQIQSFVIMIRTLFIAVQYIINNVYIPVILFIHKCIMYLYKK